MKDTDYVYAVAYIKTLENKMLSVNDFNELINARSTEDCIKKLEEKGYTQGAQKDIDFMLEKELEKTVQEVQNVCGEERLLKFFLLKNDFHNLKTALKGEATKKPYRDFLLGNSLVSAEVLTEAVKNKSFSLLPDYIRDSAKEGSELLEKSPDAQSLDVFLDKKLWEVLLELAKEEKDDFLCGWVRLNIRIINMKIASRATGKSADFIKKAMPEYDGEDYSELIDASKKSLDDVIGAIIAMGYPDGARALKLSFAEFEKWCDNLKINYIKGAKNKYFGTEAIFAFLIAKEYELQAVRIILYAKRRGVAPDEIRERVRDFYV